MEQLIRLGCPLAVRDQQLWLTPLHVAASEGHMAAVKHLLSKVTGCSISSAHHDSANYWRVAVKVSGSARSAPLGEKKLFGI